MLYINYFGYLLLIVYLLKSINIFPILRRSLIFIFLLFITLKAVIKVRQSF